MEGGVEVVMGSIGVEPHHIQSHKQSAVLEWTVVEVPVL